MNELALFAGAGGGLLGTRLLGFRPVCAVEIDPYAREVLLRRQEDGCFEPFPIWGDIRTFDGKPWRGKVDVITGGFPCQDISAAGNGEGIDGERSGLWSEFARIIGEVRPRFAFVENSPALTFRGLGRVLGDLAEMGFDAKWGVLGAADAIWNQETPAVYHDRYRIWVVAKSDNSVCFRWNEMEQQEQRRKAIKGSVSPFNWGIKQRRKCDWWQVEPDVGRVVNGLAFRTHRLRAIGNGQVPAVVVEAWNRLTKGI